MSELGSEQLELIPSTAGGVDSFFGDAEADGVYTAERLVRDRPRIAQIAVTMLAEGVPLSRIRSALGIHHYTLVALGQRFPSAIEREKQRSAGLAKHAGRLAVEKIIESLDKLPVESIGDMQRMAVVAGIMLEKGELLSGGVTARIEHGSQDRVEDLERVWKTLPGVVIDVPEAATAAKAGSLLPSQLNPAQPCEPRS